MKPSKKLPKWVPPVFAVHYDRILTGEDGEVWKNGPYGGGYGLLAEYGYTKEQLVPTITSLCTAPEMESAWPRLEKTFEEHDWKGWEWHFLCHLLFALYRRSPWDTLTPKQRQAKHDSIIKQVRELAASLRDYELDHPVWKFIQPVEFEGAIDRHPFTSFTSGYRESDIEGRERPSLFLPGNPPYVADILERLSEKASTEKLHELTLVERNAGLGRDYIIFARRMGTYFTQFLGSPHYETVAALARVLLCVEVDADTVRKTIAGSPHDKEKTFYRE